MIYLGAYKAGTAVRYAANFHSDQGALADPTSPAARLCNPAGDWSDLTTPAKLDGATGHFGGAVDTTSFAAGQYLIRMSGTVATAKAVATEFCFQIVAYDPTDAVRLGLTNLDATITSRHAAGAAVAKSPATLASTDVTGNLPADVKAITDGVDFTAAMKSSLDAATPASVQNIAANGSGFTALGDTRLANLDATISSRHPSGAAVAKSPATLAASDVTGNLPVADSSGITTLLTRIAAALTITSGKVDINDKTGFAVGTGGITSSAFAANAIDAAAASADFGAELAAALLDLANAIETGLSPRNALRLIAASASGNLSGAGTGTEILKSAQSAAKSRITATVDVDGNRTIVTDLT